MRYKFCSFILFFNFSLSSLFSQSGWTSKPFNQKVFIENKGQFNEMDGDEASEIFFGASCEGVQLFLSKNRLTYKYEELLSDIERESSSGDDRKIEKEHLIKFLPSYFSLEWVNANPNPEIISENPVSFYFTYANTTIKSHAYKKIIYKNLYPKIDLEFIFPDDTSGIKYSILLHPGANPDDIKIRYNNGLNIYTDNFGNLVIKTSFGEFTDHAPKTFYEFNKLPINSFFQLNGNQVSIKLEGYDKTHSVIIDPWITNPAFSGYNSAYDINYDLSGNVYAFGSFNDFQLAKFNNAGALQWIFNATGFGTAGYYGDFAVDEVTGTSYLVEGYNSAGAQIYKVNTLGIQVGVFPGNINMNEMWRAEYNRCIKKIVIAGGGTSVPSYNAAVLDTDLTNINIVQFVSPADHTDMTLLCIDNSSNYCYMASDSLISPFFDNKIFKCPIPSLVPFTFVVPAKSLYGELSSVNYIGGSTYPLANGMNGMAVSPSWLYTYDSDSLKRWDKNTGIFISEINVSPLLPNYFGSSIQISWGGLSVDECDNIYVGCQTSIKEYNSSLSQVNSFILPDTVNDVKLGLNNKLYACGRGFVTEINLPTNTMAVIATQTPETNCNSCDGTATVSSTSCVGNLSGFNYSWNTSPVQTTQTATGLCSGNYSVTLTTNCFMTFTGVVTVTSGGVNVANAGSDITIYIGNNASLNGTGAGSYSWTPTIGLSCITCPNPVISPTATTTYTLIVTDTSGCNSMDIVTVFVVDQQNCSAEGDLFLPSVFTPNGDGINDVFKIPSEGLKSLTVKIYNRWGIPIALLSNINEVWDGRTTVGTPCSDGVYYYVLHAVCINDKEYSEIGFVHLMR